MKSCKQGETLLLWQLLFRWFRLLLGWVVDPLTVEAGFTG
jgi:hypothetical protein